MGNCHSGSKRKSVVFVAAAPLDGPSRGGTSDGTLGVDDEVAAASDPVPGDPVGLAFPPLSSPPQATARPANRRTTPNTSRFGDIVM